MKRDCIYEILLYIFSHIANSDQTPVQLDYPEKCTVEMKGKKSIVMRTISIECQHCTDMLCITADRWKLPSYVVLKRQTISNDALPQGNHG